MKAVFTTKLTSFWDRVFSSIPEHQKPGKLKAWIEKKGGFFTVTIESVKKPKTIAQLKLFHLLISEFWISGLSSYRNWQSIKDTVKYRYGAGFETLTFKKDDVLFTVKPDEEIPEGAELKAWVLKSCGDYSIGEMVSLINGLIREMQGLGVNSEKFDSIVGEFRG